MHEESIIAMLLTHPNHYLLVVVHTMLKMLSSFTKITEDQNGKNKGLKSHKAHIDNNTTVSLNRYVHFYLQGHQPLPIACHCMFKHSSKTLTLDTYLLLVKYTYSIYNV